MSSVPKTYKTKAASLRRYLKSDQDVSWDSMGQLILKGQVVPQTHMMDLIHDALRKRKKVKRAKGWSQLSRHLTQRNIPGELIGNQDWLQDKQDKEQASADADVASSVAESTPIKQGFFTPLAKIKDRMLGRNTPSQAETPIRQPRASKAAGKAKIKTWLNLDG